MNKWISADENLPDNDVSVIIYPYAYQETSDFQITGFCNDGKWLDERGFEHKVTHWMPLPESPSNGQ